MGEEEFRRRLRLIMQQFGSVADLARAVGVSDNAIYQWVSGRGQPSMISLVNLTRAARVSIRAIEEGDLMLVDLREPRFRHDGGLRIAGWGELSIERIQRRPDGKLIIRNDNTAYEPTVVAADNVNVVGHVIWIAGKL